MKFLKNETPFESEKDKTKHKDIAIICLNDTDFNAWVENYMYTKKIKTYGRTNKEFTDARNDVTFHRIVHYSDTCSLNLDDYYTTKLGIHNPHIDKIRKSCKMNLNAKNVPFDCEQSNNEMGLYNKYHLTKTSGKPIDPNAEYFVLRLDNGCKDKRHLDACRKAALTYANEIKDHLPKLSKELIDSYDLNSVMYDNIKKDFIDLINDCNVVFSDNVITYMLNNQINKHFRYLKHKNIFSFDYYIFIPFSRKYSISEYEFKVLLIKIIDEVLGYQDVIIETHSTEL
ncbi:MAG: hypothetical protein ACOC2W_03850 [bacterium]